MKETAGEALGHAAALVGEDRQCSTARTEVPGRMR